MYKLKNDNFRKNRGGNSRVLDVTCENCNAHIAFYQKDGPGPLMRMYVDRFIDIKPKTQKLDCKSCAESLGVLYSFKKENRPAYKLFVGAIKKRIISANQI